MNQNINNNNNGGKKGTRGRKMGAVSFCKVPLSELNRILKGDAEVIVSIRFAQMLGLKGGAMKGDTSTISGIVNAKDTEIELEKFTEDSGLQPEITLDTF